GRPVQGAGRWRRMLVFGRGPGGKFYTALDVTSPGIFNGLTPAVGANPPTLPVATNPPWVMWSRGNVATDPGFLKMGETWSVTAIGNVTKQVTDSSGNVTTEDDWRVFVGSGYGDAPGEGATFYELDAITGNIVLSKDLSGGLPTYVTDNALVAGPTGFNPF